MRKPGGLVSLVQQHEEAAITAKAEAANMQTRRIMGLLGLVGV